MAIPRAQLETWANVGATGAPVLTHMSIRYALETASTSVVKGHDFEIFLQGSYPNATNIRTDSDVDVVVLSHEAFTRDPSRLVGVQRATEDRDWALLPTATYGWTAFRRDVLASLRAYYGAASVPEGNRAIKVDGGNGRLTADIIPSIEHKLYTSYGVTLAVPRTSVSGITFWDRAGSQVVNFPKQHIDNGQTKNALGQTNGNYKPTVRMFKNARRYLVERGRLGQDVAPSYFVECLLYNVPNNLFVADRQVAMRSILQWLSNTNKALFLCQNGQVFLFGFGATQWAMPNADALLAAMTTMWNDWPI